MATVASAAEACARLETGTPALVVMDVKEPGKDADTLARLIDKTPRLDHLKVLVLGRPSREAESATTFGHSRIVNVADSSVPRV